MTGSDQKIRFEVLDPLRMLAALAVVFYHYSVFFDDTDKVLTALSKYGYLGVNFFFLLSGFVIMASAQNRTPFAFALARAVRIYPAFIVCLLLTVATITFLGGSSVNFIDVLSNATILNDYIGIENIDGVYWTLQAELKFYGCVFILMLLRVFQYWRIWLSLWLAISITHYLFGQPFFMGWFINPEYSFYFIAGVCSYLLFSRDRSVLVAIIFWVSAAFGCLMAGGQAENFLVKPSSSNKVIATFIVMSFFLFFFGLSRGKFRVKNEKKWWVYFGAMSYPLYLLHNAAGKTIIIFFQSDLNVYMLAALIIVLLLAVSVLINFLIEKPINLLFTSKK